MLHHYWDHQVLAFLHYGFPFGVSDSTKVSTGTVDNHSSALQFADHVDHYLKTELDHNAILGPFKQVPIDNLHYSPMMTRPKAGSSKRRVIIDLSWPHGSSVNDLVCSDAYLITHFSLTFPTVDTITDRIVQYNNFSCS